MGHTSWASLALLIALAIVLLVTATVPQEQDKPIEAAASIDDAVPASSCDTPATEAVAAEVDIDTINSEQIVLLKPPQTPPACAPVGGQSASSPTEADDVGAIRFVSSVANETVHQDVNVTNSTAVNNTQVVNGTPSVNQTSPADVANHTALPVIQFITPAPASDAALLDGRFNYASFDAGAKVYIALLPIFLPASLT